MYDIILLIRVNMQRDAKMERYLTSVKEHQID